MLISVIIPAFNEEAYLGETLMSLNRAKALLEDEMNVAAEIIVVDNDSTDSTSKVARDLGANVVSETHHNVAKVRNSGAKVSKGEVLVFVDADTLVPDKLLSRIASVMADASCVGGAVDTDHRPQKLTVRLYLQLWRAFGKFMGMAQGASQFYRRDVFFALNGYDESLFMGEDVDLYLRLKRIANQQQRVAFIDDPKVLPSTRRFDQWRLWRTVLWTNPLVVLMFRRRKACWRGWYSAMPR